MIFPRDGGSSAKEGFSCVLTEVCLGPSKGNMDEWMSTCRHPYGFKLQASIY